MTDSNLYHVEKLIQRRLLFFQNKYHNLSWRAEFLRIMLLWLCLASYIPNVLSEWPK